jgi:hypothetical protein
MQLHVVPLGHARCSAPFRLGGEHAQHFTQLRRLHASTDTDRTQVMAMQFFGEPPKDRVLGIGRNTLDDELPTCDTECERRAVFQQALGAPHHRVHCRTEGRVAIGVHRVSL